MYVQMATDERFISPDNVDTLQFDWGTSKWLCTPEVTGSEAFSAGITILEPGKSHERHRHPDSEEILYFLDGQGVQTIGDDRRDVGPGDVVYIPAGVEHSTENPAWEPLKFLAVYGPPGPEATLSEDTGSTVLPPGEIPER
jgi:oxalate decarboxylase/phosphoglucose isomerase-like protein (cupin superfamily)